MKIKRYFMSTDCWECEDEDGKWCEYVDVERLQAENERLKIQCKNLGDNCIKHASQIHQLEIDKQKLLDHAKWLHDCLDEIPCKICEEIEQKALEDK